MKNIFFLITFLHVHTIIHAQTSTRLTFKEAVKIGLENNPVLNQEKNNSIVTSATRTSTLLQLTPNVSVQGNLGRNDGNSFNQQQGQVINGVLDFMGANLNANMPVFNGFSNINTYRQSIAQNEAQLHVVKRSTQDVIQRVANQFLNCLFDQRLVDIQKKNVETQKQLYNQIKEHVQAGSLAEIDVFNQEYQLKNAELLLLRAENTLKNDKAMLAVTLQIDSSTPFDLEEPEWDINHADTELQPIEQLHETALVQRSDLAQARSDQKALQLGYYSTKGSYLPSIIAFAQYGSRYNYIHPTSDFNPDNRSFDNQFFKDNIQLTYGLSFNIPILGGLQTRSAVVRTKMAAQNAELNTSNSELVVKSDVLRAYQNYNDAKLNFQATDTQLRAAKTSYTLEKERYELGISDLVVLAMANQNYTRAQADAANARYTLILQRMLINYAIGTLKFEDIP